ncbi:MAG TPA: DUF748 domain-containing protein [Candidatus Binataceae bacterium]|nr:DUF748 domain-containing protein [Candidatus Binataceae bacterium]
MTEGAAKPKSWRERAIALGHIRWLRRTVIGVAIALILFTILGFFIIPAVLRHVLKVQVAQSLARPVDVGEITFNPYTLRLEVDQLHVGDHDSPAPFVDLAHLHVRASWASIYHLAPVVREVALTRPQIHVVRTAPQTFNFSDLLERPSAPPPPQPSKPFRFAVSNIQISNGDVEFDDKVLNQQHRIQKIQLGVPFVANLPADIESSVQPLLQMDVDGSPIRIAGKAKPFVATPESVINFKLDHLALPPYLGYVPVKLPIKLPSGALSADLQIHFVKTEPEPAIAVAGTVSVDQLAVQDSTGAPLVGFNQLVVPLNDIEPLVNVFRVGALKLDGLTVNAVLNHDGTTNFSALSAAQKAPAGAGTALSPAASGTPRAASSPALASTASSPVPTGDLSSPIPKSPMEGPAISVSATPIAAPMVAVASASPIASQAATLPSPASVASASPAVGATRFLTPTEAATPATGSPAATPATAAALPQSITAAAPAASASPAASPATPTEHPLDFTLDSFALTNGTVSVNDQALAAPIQLALQAIQIGVNNFAIGPRAAPAPYNFAANLSTGGSIATKGSVDLVKSQSTSDVTLSQIDLPALQGFAQAVLAGTIASGKLNAHAAVLENFAPGHINVHVEPATIALDDFALQYANSRVQPIKWKEISTNIAQVDLAAQKAVVNEVRSQGIQLDVRHFKNGTFSLEALLKHPPSATPPVRSQRAVRPERRRPEPRRTARVRERSPATPPATIPTTSTPKWTYIVKAVALEQTGINFEDETAPKPVKLTLAPLNINLKNISDDFSKPITLAVDGTVNREGGFKVGGKTVIQPLKANLRVNTHRLDLTLANAYLANQLNATIASAVLTMNAQVNAAMVRKKMELGYRGDMTVGSVRLLDKVTGEDFARWTSFAANGINVKIGSGEPLVRIGGLALTNFYARIILNRDGKLNLKDIAANPNAAPTSLTEQHNTVAAATPAPTPAAAASPSTLGAATTLPTAPPKPIPADVAVDQTTLSGGHIIWEDYFIQPNYKADLTDLGGHIGTIGTRTTAPADVNIQGEINDTSPISITGSVNPLTPQPFIDITAKANAIELANMSAYSTKYTGYPIVSGTLTVDVHYLLQQNNLTAQNHILLDQLTFGDKVTTPGAGNLPVRLAVAILKDSKGQINLDIPVSGSLSDPQFSIGSVIWHAFSNILVKAVTAPFSLIAGAFGGHAGASVNYIAFKPGFATLTGGAKQQLDGIAKALQARQSLKLQLTGVVDPTVDRDGLRDAALDHAMREQKAKDTGQNIDQVTIEPDEYNKYLYKAYKAADFTKPRDFVGMTKKLPAPEMTKLMLANAKVTDASLKTLADARAQAVASYLEKQIPPSRITIGPPLLDASSIKDGGKTTRVNLSLE